MEKSPQDRLPPMPGTPASTSQNGLPSPASSRGPIDRIVQQAKFLGTDVVEWVELKVQLTQMEIEEKVEQKLNGVAVGAIGAGLGVLTIWFSLMALGFGLGAWLGHPAWGFLIVTVLLALTTLIFFRMQPRLVKIGNHSEKPDARLPASTSTPPPALPEATKRP